MTKWLTALLVLVGMFGAIATLPPTAECADPPAASTSMEKVNINAATVEQLTALPGIGPAIAGGIVEYREKNGAFRQVEDLLRVKGIGEKKLEAVRGMVVVE